jgi:uncharacterized protein
MIAVDTNILVYAHREESPFYQIALDVIADLINGPETWAIPWPCVHEFLNVVTNARIFSLPTPLIEALEQVAEWMRSPTLILLAESPSHWKMLREVLEGGRGVSGPRVHDARIVALCRQHGVRELWSADRDFSRFRNLKVVNPLLRSD